MSELLAAHYTVVTYDPRGISRSRLDGAPPQQGVIQEHADDVQRLLAAIGSEPAYVFAHSSGGSIAMDHLVRHHEQVRTLVLYEPTVIGYLDRSILVGQDMPTTYREQGLPAALAKFTQLTGIEAKASPANPSPEMQLQMNRLTENRAYVFGHMFPAVIDFVPDLDALKAIRARIVVGIGDKSAEQPAHKSALRLAADLGLAPVSFPSDHVSFLHEPVDFAARLRSVLHPG
jgi:pimeloyl-ACP methyl ester carboxylesterase